MAKVITTELQHSGASGANVTLDSSKNVTCENNLTVDGTTTLTGAVTLPNDTVDIADLSATGTASSSTFLRGDNEWAAAGSLLKKTYYEIPRGTFSSTDFPNDDTIPQIDEGTLVFSQAYTPTNTSGCEIWVTTHFHLAETSNVSNAIIAALFISDNTSALQVRSAYQEGNDTYHNVNITIIHKMATWSGAKTLSIRAAGVNSVNYQHYGSSNWATAIYGAEASKSPFIIEEVST